MNDVVLSLSGVTRNYGQKIVTQALRGVNLEVRAGEFMALIGPSGSGKSTLLNVMGLLDRPTSGKIRIAGHDTAGLDEEALTRLRAKALGFVFQFHHLIPSLTAAENVMVPMWADRGRADAAMRQRALELLRAFGLEEKANTKSTDMSGGQQQRVAIARALAMNPPVVLADEPTGNLDTKTADDVFELLRRQNVERGTTFVIVTHDPRLAQRADRIVELVDGVIQSDRVKA